MRFLTLALLTGVLHFPFALRLLAQNKIADLVIINANVRTMAQRRARAAAIALTGNRIIAVGSSAEVRKHIGPDTKTINAKGKLVLPGFNDAHVHFAAIGNSFSSINLRYAKTPNEVRESLAFYAKFLSKGRWILGGAWDNSKWLPDDLPSRKLIDSVTPDNPVFIYHTDGKSGLANTLALKLAGIDRSIRPALELSIDRNENKDPTGILRGAAMRIVTSIIPQTHTKNWPEVIETASNYAASLGVTSIQDMHSDDLSDIYRDLERHGKLKTRVYDCVSLTDWAKEKAPTKTTRVIGSSVRKGCVKSFSDGDEKSVPHLKQQITAADKAGLQVMIHAIGRKSNTIVLDIFEQASKENGPRDRRFRIEHAHDAGFENIKRFGRLRIVPSMQPFLFFGDIMGAVPYNDLLDNGGLLAFGSDAPMTDFNPMFGIAAAIVPKHDNIKSLSVEEAVYAYTIGAAYAEFQEKMKGTIEIGKLADLIILSNDIFTIHPESVKDVRVLTTIVDGKVVFQAQ